MKRATQPMPPDDILVGMGFEHRTPSLRILLGPDLDAGDPTRVYAIASGSVTARKARR